MKAINGLKAKDKANLAKLKGNMKWNEFIIQITETLNLVGVKLPEKSKELLQQVKAENIPVSKVLDMGLSYAAKMALKKERKVANSETETTGIGIAFSSNRRIEAFIIEVIESGENNKLTQRWVYNELLKRTGSGANKANIGESFRQMKEKIKVHNEWVKAQKTQE